MKLRKLKIAARLSLIIPVVAVMTAAFATSAQAEPPTKIRPATMNDMVTPEYPWDLNWLEIQNPHGKEKLLSTMTENNLPTGGQVATNITNSKGVMYNSSDWIGNPFTTTNTPSLDNGIQNFTYVPQQNAWHWVVNDAVSQIGVPGGTADIWIHNWSHGAAYDAPWDSPQHVHWSSTVGTGDATGWVQFPDTVGRTKVDHWAFEQERMAGPHLLFAPHKGYDYAQSGNPDGSADILFIYDELDGTKRGLLAHTASPAQGGQVTYCEPTAINMTDWRTDTKAVDRGLPVAPFSWPNTVSASCNTGHGVISLKYTCTWEHLFPVKVGPTQWVVGASTMNDGHEDNRPGSVATIQHYRDPNFIPGTGAPYYTEQS